MAKKARATAKKAQTKRASATSNMALWLVAAAAVGLVGLAIWLNIRQAGNVVTVAEAQEAYKDVPTEWISGRTLGNPEAAVTVQVWEDFM
ncbi:MAG: hypothetical protein R2911_19715 [Caldilineaceae bacterium]